MPGERLVNAGDAVESGGDGFSDRHPGAFLAGSARARAATEAGVAGNLIEQGVALGPGHLEPTGVGPLLGLGDFSIEVDEALTIGGECFLVGPKGTGSS